MPTTPYALVQMSVNSGGPVQGGQTVAGGATIQLSGVNTSNWSLGARWEIYAYPNGWAAPSGWTLDSNTGIVYSTDTTPTLITLEAAATRWGKWLVRLVVNGGVKNGVPPVQDPVTGSYLPNDVIDIASGWQVLSPQFGFSEPALFESTQFGGLRRWVDPVQKSLHLIDAASFGGGGGGVTWQLGTDAAYQITGTTATQFIVIPTLTAARTWKMPTAPSDGMQCGLDDRNAVLVDSGNTLSATTAGGTDHFIIGGIDKGTTWQIPASLFKGGMPLLTRRVTSSTWELT